MNKVCLVGKSLESQLCCSNCWMPHLIGLTYQDSVHHVLYLGFQLYILKYIFMFLSLPQFQATYGKPLLAARDSKCSAKDAEAGALAMEALHKQVSDYNLGLC